MQKFIETINNLVKLISSLVTLAVLGAVVYFGLKAYHTAAEFTSKPIQMPTVQLPEVKLPKIQIEAPEIKLPEVKLPEIPGFAKKEEPGKAGQWGFKDASLPAGPVYDYPLPGSSTRCHHAERCADIIAHCIKKREAGEW